MKNYKQYWFDVYKCYKEEHSVIAESEEEAEKQLKCDIDCNRIVFRTSRLDDDEEDRAQYSYELTDTCELTKRQKIVQAIKGLPTKSKLALHNAYCDSNGYADEYYHCDTEVGDFIEGKDPLDVVKILRGFDAWKPYFTVEKDGHLLSRDEWSSLEFSIRCEAEDIAKEIENGETYGLDFIEEMVKE